MMTNHETRGPHALDSDPALAEVAEQITRRLQAGQTIDEDDYVRRHPTLAAPIRLLMPAICGLAELGQLFPRRRPGGDRRIR
jgi:hypothetical protein